ncbi:tudor domain-containing protein 5-like [Melanerpes formicivorus]|uniref:tudor domain-containing protein 5-like n=1 Tax=Melanerpes formicivorus TaxID=211600 RepID=UPI00358E9FFA
MAKEAQLLQLLKKELRSLLLAAREGLTPARLEQQYLAMVGKPLPLHDLGFQSTLELVAAMPEAVKVCHHKGRTLLKGIPDESTKGIADLLGKRRSSRTRRGSRRSGAAGGAGAAAPSPSPQRSKAGTLPATADAAEMPPLESSSDTESFHLPSEEESEAVATEAGGLGAGLQQPEALEQALLEKLILTPEMPPDAVQDRRLCSLPPLERRSMVAVFVSSIISPSQFYIQLYSKETSSKLREMMCEMRFLYSHRVVSDRYLLPEALLRPGQLCCLLLADWWHRAVIHRLLSPQQVQVFCVDHGHLKTVQRSALRLLKWCYLKLPAQALPCSLAGVQPMQGTWSSAATLQFQELCGSKLLVGITDEYVNGVLHLFLCDTSTKEDVYVHQVLSSRGHAAICKENVPSQGFQELNPSALYIQPSGQQESLAAE